MKVSRIHAAQTIKRLAPVSLRVLAGAAGAGQLRQLALYISHIGQTFQPRIVKSVAMHQAPGRGQLLHAKAGQLMAGLKAEADAAGVPFSVDHQGGLFGFFLLPELPSHYEAVMKSDKPLFNKFFHSMLSRGHYFAPALYEAGFVSSAHTDADIQATIEAAREVFKTL